MKETDKAPQHRYLGTTAQGASCACGWSTTTRLPKTARTLYLRHLPGIVQESGVRLTIA